MDTPLIPQSPSGKPSFPEILFHVSPPSVDFHNPDPSPPLSKLYGVLLIFQVEANIILGLFLSIEISTAPDL